MKRDIRKMQSILLHCQSMHKNVHRKRVIDAAYMIWIIVSRIPLALPRRRVPRSTWSSSRSEDRRGTRELAKCKPLSKNEVEAESQLKEGDVP